LPEDCFGIGATIPFIVIVSILNPTVLKLKTLIESLPLVFLTILLVVGIVIVKIFGLNCVVVMIADVTVVESILLSIAVYPELYTFLTNTDSITVAET
jgi:hypothetical protein